MITRGEADSWKVKGLLAYASLQEAGHQNQQFNLV